MKDILIITNYFPPEIGAASNRIYHLAEGLSTLNYNVNVIAPLPNYPTGKVFDAYRGKFHHKTTDDNNITINRLWIYASNSKNKLFRLFAMLSYSLSLIWFIIFKKVPKTVIINSPPLIVAFTCLLFLSRKKHKLILNVSDLWPKAGLELGALKPGFSYKILQKIETYNYKKADVILGQSEEILQHISNITPNKELVLYRNYPDFKVENIAPKTINSEKITIVYAGLLGIAQGIYKLIKNLDYTNIEFHIYGNGAERAIIEEYIAKHPELPIIYHGEVTRTELHKKLTQYDITIIPLLNRIYGSVPSKIFEYARLGLPMIYFGGGEGEFVIKNYNLGWIAEAGNYSALNSVIHTIKKEDLTTEYSQQVQNTAISNFDFKAQLKSIKNFI